MKQSVTYQLPRAFHRRQCLLSTTPVARSCSCQQTAVGHERPLALVGGGFDYSVLSKDHLPLPRQAMCRKTKL